MPTLEWVNREVAVRVAPRAPFRLLEHDPALSCGDPDNENMLIQGDNLMRRMFKGILGAALLGASVVGAAAASNAWTHVKRGAFHAEVARVNMQEQTATFCNNGRQMTLAFADLATQDHARLTAVWLAQLPRYTLEGTVICKVPDKGSMGFNGSGTIEVAVYDTRRRIVLTKVASAPCRLTLSNKDSCKIVVAFACSNVPLDTTQAAQVTVRFYGQIGKRPNKNVVATALLSSLNPDAKQKIAVRNLSIEMRKSDFN